MNKIKKLLLYVLVLALCLSPLPAAAAEESSLDDAETNLASEPTPTPDLPDPPDPTPPSEPEA